MVEERMTKLEKQINELKKRVEKLEKHTHVTEIGHFVKTPIITEK
jgi:hypothetical protein